MNGFPHLKRHHGTKIWCLDNMVEIFENPRGHNLGCTLGEAFKVDRAFRHGERFRWEEFEFEITHSPGHTNYQMALFVTIDGNRVAFTGDAFFPNPGGTSLRHNLIFRNDVQNDSHLRSIRNLIEHEPTVIAPGHGRPYPVDRSLLLATEERLRKQQQLFHDLLPEGEVDFGMDPSWVKIYPYQILIGPGERQKVEIRARNYKRGEAMKLEVALVTPEGWRVEPDVVTLEIPPGGRRTRSVQVSVPGDWKAALPRFAVAADVMRDGRYLGQITEAIVEMRQSL